MSSKKKPTAARRAVPLRVSKPASTSSKASVKSRATQELRDRLRESLVMVHTPKPLPKVNLRVLVAQTECTDLVVAELQRRLGDISHEVIGDVSIEAVPPSIPNSPPRESAPAAPSTASGVQTAQQPPAVEDRPAATPLSPSQQLLANAIDGYEAARADIERAAAVLKGAVEAERLAQLRIDEATGAHAASKNEALRSREQLCKALNEQAPGQLIARKGRHYLASGHLLREFDAPQSL